MSHHEHGHEMNAGQNSERHSERIEHHHDGLHHHDLDHPHADGLHHLDGARHESWYPENDIRRSGLFHKKEEGPTQNSRLGTGWQRLGDSTKGDQGSSGTAPTENFEALRTYLSKIGGPYVSDFSVSQNAKGQLIIQPIGNDPPPPPRTITGEAREQLETALHWDGDKGNKLDGATSITIDKQGVLSVTRMVETIQSPNLGTKTFYGANIPITGPATIAATGIQFNPNPTPCNPLQICLGGSPPYPIWSKTIAITDPDLDGDQGRGHRYDDAHRRDWDDWKRINQPVPPELSPTPPAPVINNIVTQPVQPVLPVVNTTVTAQPEATPVQPVTVVNLNLPPGTAIGDTPRQPPKEPNSILEITGEATGSAAALGAVLKLKFD